MNDEVWATPEKIIVSSTEPVTDPPSGEIRTLLALSRGDGKTPPRTKPTANGRKKTKIGSHGKLPDILKEVPAGGDTFIAFTDADVIASKDDFDFLATGARPGDLK